MVPSLSSLCPFSSTFWDPAGSGESERKISALIPVGNQAEKEQGLDGLDQRAQNGKQDMG